jgi:hypothetical protein
VIRTPEGGDADISGIAYARKNSKRLLCGLFYSQIEADLEVRIKKAGSVWTWHEEFAVEWGETFLTKKREKRPRKGE